MKNILAIFLLSALCSFKKSADNSADSIIGKWMNAEDNNLEVEIYKSGNEYKAKVIWFDDSDDKSRPMAERCDTKNPDKALRNRKIVGMEVMYGLVYNLNDDEWQDGRIYDSSSGKEWSAKAWLAKDGSLKVRGYWHFEFLGQNMHFKKVS
jgi:uncharacterized protein (DUF2147 family)